MKVLVALLMMWKASSADAWHWQDLWLTPDQQGQRLMQQGQFNEAAKHFQQSDWQATALYRGQSYEKAAQYFESSKTDDA